MVRDFWDTLYIFCELLKNKKKTGQNIRVTIFSQTFFKCTCTGKRKPQSLQILRSQFAINLCAFFKLCFTIFLILYKDEHKVKQKTIFNTGICMHLRN